MSLRPISLNLVEKLADAEYFHEYFGGRAQDDIALGIRELREKRAMKQGDLAEACEMKQSAVSRMEDPEYSGWSFNSLRRIAAALDARLVISFQSRESVLQEMHKKSIEKHFKEVVVASESTDSYAVSVGSSTSFLPAELTHV